MTYEDGWQKPADISNYQDATCKTEPWRDENAPVKERHGDFDDTVRQMAHQDVGPQKLFHNELASGFSSQPITIADLSMFYELRRRQVLKRFAKDVGAGSIDSIRADTQSEDLAFECEHTIMNYRTIKGVIYKCHEYEPIVRQKRDLSRSTGNEAEDNGRSREDGEYDIRRQLAARQWVKHRYNFNNSMKGSLERQREQQHALQNIREIWLCQTSNKRNGPLRTRIFPRLTTASVALFVKRLNATYLLCTIVINHRSVRPAV